MISISSGDEGRYIQLLTCCVRAVQYLKWNKVSKTYVYSYRVFVTSTSHVPTLGHVSKNATFEVLYFETNDSFVIEKIKKTSAVQTFLVAEKIESIAFSKKENFLICVSNTSILLYKRDANDMFDLFQTIDNVTLDSNETISKALMSTQEDQIYVTTDS